jgi:hypothetical protein
MTLLRETLRLTLYTMAAIHPRLIRRRALLLTMRLAVWASERLAGPGVRAKMRELEPPR